MNNIFVNLKRFDVSKTLGGICPIENPKEWIEKVIDDSVKYGIGTLEDIKVTYLLPEGLVITACDKLSNYPQKDRKNINIGCQGVFRENVKIGGNFGAFTTNLPAAAAKNLGCSYAIVGHSEERKDKLGIIEEFESIKDNEELLKKALNAINSLINKEVLCALSSSLNVLLCVGETATERGIGDFEEQKPRIREVLKSQLEIGLKDTKKYLPEREIAIGYEPIWAIGPGKIPPDKDYISFVSSYIKSIVKGMYGFDIPVVYGGGLKEENAKMISNIDTIDGGLVALTKFTGDIAFEVEGLEKIIKKYIE